MTQNSTKQCPRCHLVKKSEEFGNDKKRKDRLQVHCKDCQRIYRQKNEKRIKEYAQKYRNSHREQNIIYCRKYYKQHFVKKENPQLPNLIHGMTGTKIYITWRNMKTRCEDIEDKDYGGRGITYAPHWKSFVGFYKDMGASYKEGLTIERKDVNGNYTPENCIWIEGGKQGENTRRNRTIVLNGKSYKFFELVKEYGINYQTLYNRIFYYDMSPELAVSYKRGRENAN